MSWCNRCGKFDVWGKGCGCEVRGFVWHPEGGETERDAREIWSVHSSPDSAVMEWAERRHARDSECFSEEDETIAFRPTRGGGKVLYFNVRYEIVPSFIVCEARDHDIREARRRQANSLRNDRAYERRRRQLFAAQRARDAVPMPMPAHRYFPTPRSISTGALEHA